MSYTLQRFGAITLPLYNRKTDATPVQPRVAVVATAAGSFDAWGSERAAPKFPHTITLACIVAEDTTGALRTAIDALRAAVGTRATLYRSADDDGAVQRCNARLIDMDYQREPKHRIHQTLKLVWQQLDAWSGDRYEDWVLDDGFSLDDGYLLDTGAITFSPPTAGEFTVGGNLSALDVRLTITFDATDTDPCYVIAADGGICLAIDGPWADGDVLYIDSQARTITLNGNDAYSRLDLDAGYGAYDHTATEWMPLAPGFQQILVVNAAADEASFEYVEAWA